MKRPVHFKGWPKTAIRHNQIGIKFWYRNPVWMQHRKSMWQFGNVCLLAYFLYHFLSNHFLNNWFAGGFLVACSIIWGAFLNIICFRSRSFCFSPKYITFTKGLSIMHQTFNRLLPHGFRVQGFEIKNGYRIYMDHLESSVLVCEIFGTKQAEMVTRRLINVSEYMGQEFPNRDFEQVTEETKQRRSTFARG